MMEWARSINSGAMLKFKLTMLSLKLEAMQALMLLVRVFLRAFSFFSALFFSLFSSSFLGYILFSYWINISTVFFRLDKLCSFSHFQLILNARLYPEVMPPVDPVYLTYVTEWR